MHIKTASKVPEERSNSSPRTEFIHTLPSPFATERHRPRPTTLHIHRPMSQRCRSCSPPTGWGFGRERERRVERDSELRLSVDLQTANARTKPALARREISPRPRMNPHCTLTFTLCALILSSPGCFLAADSSSSSSGEN